MDSAAPRPGRAPWLKHLDLALVIADRELRGRYRGSWLGWLWTLADPILMICIFYVIFTVIFQRSYPHYLLYLMSGLLPFYLFNNGVVKSTNSLINYAGLIRQVRCPRTLFVLTPILSELYHFSFGMLLVIPFYVVYGFSPGVKALAILPALLVLMLFMVGFGLLLSIVNVFIRATNLLVSHVLRIWFYLTPIFYTPELVKNLSPQAYTLFHLNPLVTLLEVFRWALMQGHAFPEMWQLGIVAGELAVVLAAGVLVFRRYENSAVKLV